MELLDVQKTDLEIDIAKLRVAARVQLTEEQIKVWLKQFCKGDLDDMEFRERIIDVFINSVYLYDDKTVIYYNIEGGKQVSYMEMLDSTEEPPFADDPQGSSGVRISNDTPRHIVYKRPRIAWSFVFLHCRSFPEKSPVRQFASARSRRFCRHFFADADGD